MPAEKEKDMYTRNDTAEMNNNMDSIFQKLTAAHAFENARLLMKESMAAINALSDDERDNLLSNCRNEACRIKALPGNRFLYRGYVFTYQDDNDAASVLSGGESFIPLRFVSAASPDIRPADDEDLAEAVEIKDVLTLLTDGNVKAAEEKYPYLEYIGAHIEDMCLDCKKEYKQAIRPHIAGEAEDPAERLNFLPDASLSEFFTSTDDFARLVVMVYDRLSDKN